MPIVCSDEGERALLEYMVNKTTPGNVKLHIYTSPTTTPTEAITLADITEVSDASYNPQTLSGASWTVATVSGVTTASYPEVTFTFAGAQSLYGYYVTDNAVSRLLWIERFNGAPFSMPSGGGTVAISPRISLD